MVLTATSIPVVSAISTDKETTSASTTTASTGANSYGLADDIQDGQILQCFNWSFDNIKKNMKQIAEQGFSAIQTSPIQTAKETTSGKTAKGSWWVLYQPSNFEIETNANGSSALGTASQFKAMCDEAHKYGVKVVVDAVLNHMANQSRNDLSSTIPSEIRNNSSLWHDITQNSWYSSRYDITQYCMDGIPDLNTGNETVQNYAIKFLKECIDNGADGFRFDGAKHIETPADSGFGSNFWPNVLNATTSYAKSTRGITPFYYGEVLDKTTGDSDQSNGQSIVNSYTSYMSITLSSVSNSIRGSVNSSNASGAARSDFNLDDGSKAAGNKSVLWNESHDTYQAGTSSYVSDSNVNKTWALVGTRNQACGMYLARPSNWGSAMMGQADVSAWADKSVQAINQFKNAMIGQTEYLSSEGSIAYNERGTKGVVLVNCSGGSQQVSVTAHKMASGSYKDAITGNEFTVSNGKISGNIGSTGIAVVYDAKQGPQATISQSGGSFKTDTLSLTLGLKDATSGTYQINSGSVETFTDTKTITIGEGVDYGSTITVKLTATNGTDTTDATYTFKKVDPNAVQKIYFDNSSYNWSSVYAYIYDSTSEVSAWPGVSMSKDSSTGYYVVEVPEDFSDGTVIFTESQSATTNRYPADMEPGLEIGGVTMLFSANHSWKEYTQQTTTTTKATTTTKPTTTTTTPSQSYLYGDINLDNLVNVKDAVQISKYVVDKATFTELQQKAADVNGDGSIDVKDATLIQKYSVKLVTSFPAGSTFTYGSSTTTQPTTTTKPTTVTTTTKPTTVTTTVAQGKTITLDVSAIEQGNERWAAYLWNDSGSVWVDMPNKTLSVPSGYDNVIFCRMNGSSTSNSWDNVWNQSEDLKVSGGSTYKATGWGSGNQFTGTWA